MTITGTEELKGIQAQPVKYWAELLTPTTGKALATYDHPYWGKYAAITENQYGKGKAFYAGSYLNEKSITELYKYVLKDVDLWTSRQEQTFPIINKRLETKDGATLNFYFNYSQEKQQVTFKSESGKELEDGTTLSSGDHFDLDPWSVKIFKSTK